MRPEIAQLFDRMTPPLAMWNSPVVWAMVVIVVLLFGGRKIPELMRGVGRGVGELQKGLEEGKQGLKNMHDTTADTEPREDDKPKA